MVEDTNSVIYTSVLLKSSTTSLNNRAHLFTKHEWNSSRCFILPEAGTLFPEGNSLCRGLELKRYSTHNQWITVLLYWCLYFESVLIIIILIFNDVVKCGTIQRYWCVINAEYTFKESNCRKIKNAPDSKWNNFNGE